jgi:hypothetical protein
MNREAAVMGAFAGLASPLSQHGIDRALDLLEVDPPAFWAVLTVETRGCGYLADRRPLILFERHVFHRLTGGAFDSSHPAISSASAGGYLGGAREYPRLEEAAALDRTAALDSASWGIGQIMGFNARSAGFATSEAMVMAMMNGEDAQVAAMAAFLRSAGLHAPLARHDWPAFARGYNGAGFAANQYDARLAGACAAFSSGPLPDLTVRQAQLLLMFLGIDAGAVDGMAGKRTRSGIRTFRAQAGLPLSDAIDDRVIAALLGAAGQASLA